MIQKSDIQKHNNGYLAWCLGVMLWWTVLLLVSCGDTFKMDYIPTAEQVKTTLPEFIVENIQIEGLYANHDVDSMIFRYVYKFSNQPAVADILSNIVMKAEKEDWRLLKRETTTLRFNRFRSSGKFFSTEEVRVIVIPKNSRVYVAWVQADSSKPVSRFEDTSEWKFAKHVIWPKLESYVAQEQ